MITNAKEARAITNSIQKKALPMDEILTDIGISATEGGTAYFLKHELSDESKIDLVNRGFSIDEGISTYRISW